MRVGGHILSAIVISQDVTEAKLAEVELAAAPRLASVGTLAAGVAHEINTPVQFVTYPIAPVKNGTVISASVLLLNSRQRYLARPCHSQC